MAQIPDHLLDRIRDSVDIVEVVQRYVSLRKRGKNYFGLCPFHREKTPSFSVNPDKQIFHCFGCGVGGNVFTFLMKYEKISFFEAVKQLADEAGIKLPTSPEMKKKVSEAEQLYRANEIALEFFHKQLFSSGKQVLEYLHNRKISEGIIKQFKLGFAPDAWDGLLRHIKNLHLSEKPFLTVGLFIQSEKEGRLYDRFRNRLMFPLHNPSGKVVGFAGRALKEDDETPKYVNSPESPIYNKSQLLYGLYFAREHIREKEFVIVVEGYMDFLQMFQNGIRNVVATSGTALTEEHGRIIRRFTKNVVLCYDSDEAGIQAAARGGEILFQQGLDVSILLLPEGEDPDSFVAQKGAETFLEFLKQRQEYLDFRLSLLEKQYRLDVASERSQAVNEILTALAPLQDSIRMGFFVEKISERWHLPPTMLLNELKKIKRKIRKRPAEGAPEQSEQATEQAPLVFVGAWSAEKDILVLLLNFFEEVRDYIFEHVEDQDFLNPEFREIYQFIQKHAEWNSQQLIHNVLNFIEQDEVRNLIARHLDQEFPNPARYLQDCIQKVKIARLQAELDVERQRIKQMQSDDPQYSEVLHRMQKIMNELRSWQSINFDVE